MKRRCYFMALAVTPTSAPPVPSTMLSSGQAFHECLLMKNWLLRKGVGRRKGTFEAGKLAPK